MCITKVFFFILDFFFDFTWILLFLMGDGMKRTEYVSDFNWMKKIYAETRQILRSIVFLYRHNMQNENIKDAE